MRPTSNSRSHFARMLALGLACCVMVLLVQFVVHGHDKGHNEAACRVCHAAHLGSAPAISTFLLDAPLEPNGHVHEISVKFHKELLAHDAPSRAPPVA
jgi:hypothetical protein